ncbi:kinase-like domain-containing protein [Sparassis latifolia]
MSSQLDLYDPLDVIGTGSFGIIRKVRRKSDGVILARKELNFERMSDRDRKQIVSEVNILKELNHEHIVRYHDRHVDREAGILYILMEYCGGGDLSSVIKQAQRHNQPIPEDTVWNYFMQLLLALNHCHHPNGHGRPSTTGSDYEGKERRPQILHRDLKPDNVFLDENNTVKLGDFGLSKALAQASFANTYVGTPYYMSPELMQERAYDSKSDMWSLGCLIYELCALRPPFHEAKTHAELSILIRNGRIPPLPKGYSQSLSSVIKTMLNLNPAMRPSAGQLLGHERLELAFKVSETQKMLNQVKAHKASLQARERDIVAREAAIAEKETRLNALLTEKETRAKALLSQKDEKIATLRSQAANTEAAQLMRIREAVTRRDEELRAMVLKQEAEVAARMARREEEIMEAVRRREEEITQMWIEWETKAREAMSRAVEERMEWVQQRAEELEHERVRLQALDEELQKKIAVLESESTQRGMSKTKTALQEVKNIMATARLSESPEPISSRALSRYSVLETPTQKAPLLSVETPVPKLLAPPSAMKGVILTATGQPIATPSPAELTKLFIGTPRIRLNFAQVFDYDSEAEDDDGDNNGDESDTCVPSPAHEEHADDTTPQPSPAVRPTRLRRPSMIRASTSRPTVEAAAAASEPKRGRRSSTRASSSQMPEPASKVRSTSTARAVVVPQPAPEYNLSDEENLPSPFIKKVDRDRISRTVSAPARAAPNVPFPRNAPRRSGPTLRTVAVVNAANAANSASTAGSGRRVSLNKTGIKSVSSTHPRSSIVKAQRASEEARKALIRS